MDTAEPPPRLSMYRTALIQQLEDSAAVDPTGVRIEEDGAVPASDVLTDVIDLRQQICQQLAQICEELDRGEASIGTLTPQRLGREEVGGQGSSGHRRRLSEPAGGYLDDTETWRGGARPVRSDTDNDDSELFLSSRTVTNDRSNSTVVTEAEQFVSVNQENTEDNSETVTKTSETGKDKKQGSLAKSDSIQSQKSQGGQQGTSEMELLRVALLQLGALKSLAVLLGCSKHIEMLLVPKSNSTMEKSLLLKQSTVGRPQEELQEAMRLIMKQMVKCAVLPSPVRRSVTIAELERAQMVLYKAAVQHSAEAQTNIKEKKGNSGQISIQ